MIKILKFSEIIVKKHSLMALVSHSSGNVNVKDIAIDLSDDPVLIDKAIIEIREKYQKLPSDHKSGIIIPVFCLDSPSPIINSVASLLVRNLPDSLSNQISSLQLESPIELRTKVSGTRGSISSTLIDITPDRIVIIGNTQEAVEYLRLFGSRLYFKELSPPLLAQQLQHLLDTYPKHMLGSSMLVGGFGAIFSFVSAFLLNKAFSGQFACFEYVFVSVIAMLAIIFFLVEEAFENKIIAFSYNWTMKVRTIAWALFLSFVLSAPLGAFLSFPIKIALNFMWICAFLISIMCALSYCGQFFRGEGWSRGIAVFARLTTAFLIWLLPYIKGII